MNELRKAAQQALEILERLHGGCIELTVDATPEIKAAGKTLIAALRGIK